MTKPSNWIQNTRADQGHETLPKADTEAILKSVDDDLSLEAIIAKKEAQKNKKRFIYAGRFIWITVGWVGFAGLILFFQGFHFFGFDLPTSVLNVLLATTTVNILTPYFLIARYLFNGNATRQDWVPYFHRLSTLIPGYHPVINPPLGTLRGSPPDSRSLNYAIAPPQLLPAPAVHP